MDVNTIPSMKPVLIDTVTDNISALQQSDVAQQKTLLSARAIADIFQCAEIKKTNAADQKFFTGELIDLDKIVVAGHRMLTADKYVNAPVIKVDKKIEGKDDKYNGGHSLIEVKPACYLYTFSQLDDGALVWENYDGKISIDETVNREIAARAKASTVRQILFVNHDEEYFTADGATDRTRVDIGTPFSRMGTLKADGSYTWETWHLMGKEHNGPKYPTNIVFKTDTTDAIVPIVDATYHIFATVDFILPNANLDGYRPGMKINVEVHPPVDGNTSVCSISYKDTNAVGEDLGRETMKLILTPKFINVAASKESGSITANEFTTSIATFEIVSLTDTSGNIIGQTWELDGDVTESDFTSGLAQLLDEHATPPLKDFVNYQSTSYSDLKEMKIAYALPTCGYALAKLLKTENVIDDAWTIRAFGINLDSGAKFIFSSDISPRSEEIYFIRRTNTDGTYRYELAENFGHPTILQPDIRYYLLDVTNSDKSEIIQIPYIEAGETKYRTECKISDLELLKTKAFSRFLNRNDIVVVCISGSYKSSFYQGKLFPAIGFYPDPHAQYVQKIGINPSAYTAKQIQNLLEKGELIQDNDQDVMQAPASTQALVNAYGYLAGILQNKGLLHGSVIRDNLDAQALDKITNGGFYWVVPKETFNPETTSWPEGNQAGVGMNLMVVSNRHSTTDTIHKDEGTIYESTYVSQFCVQNIAGSMKFHGRTGVRNSDGVTWTFTAWSDLLNFSADWDYLRNKPFYFKARWDYIVDPNTYLNRVDKYNDEGPNTAENAYEIIAKITAAEVAAAMKVNDTPEKTHDINYRVPTFLVGRDELIIKEGWKNNAIAFGMEDRINYVIDVELPQATANQLAVAAPDNRRKVAFGFYFKSEENEWKKIIFRLHYLGSDGVKQYTYKRTWSGESGSFIYLQFEQMDVPRGDRLWAPVEIG